MVSWVGDGQVSGYDAPSGSPTDGKFLLASPGSVEVNGITRLQYNIPGLTTSIRANATINFTASDVSAAAASGRKLTMTMFVAAANWFAPGVIPTPQEILALGNSLRCARAAYKALPGTTNEIYQASVPISPFIQPNLKYWVLFIPTYSVPGSAVNYANDLPYGIAGANVLGRAVSVWTNRTPSKPVITSPNHGTIVNAGAAITLTYDSGDPDEVVGGTDSKYTDLSGVQVQYAARPTQANPTPTWNDLPIANTSGGGIGKGWYIDGASVNTGIDGGLAFWTNRTMQVRCGANAVTAGYGVLPSGDWQVRVRTFDYGHPYPVSANPLNNTAGSYTPNTFPSTNTSPWSEAVNISVTAQVPPPIAIFPTNAIAIPDDTTVTLSWAYRNTFTPPFAQAQRKVQLRKVGVSSWTTLVDEVSGLKTYTIAPYTPPTDGVIERFHDACTSITNWGAVVGTGPTLVSGNRIRIANPTGGSPGFYGMVLTRASITGCGAVEDKTITISGTHNSIDSGGETQEAVSLSVLNGVASVSATRIDATGFYDSTGESVVNGQWSASYLVNGAFDNIRIGLQSANTGAGVNLEVDDVRVTVGTIVPASGFELELAQYEWRVQVIDADAEVSNYSDPATFWIVPAPASGDVRPLPATTIDGASLGCGTHRVEIYRRGGKRRVAELSEVSYVDWNRVRDDISTARIDVSGWSIDCGNLLSILKCWAYEVVIWRDNGFSEDRVWEGPITLLTYARDKVTIHAKDVMAYSYRRIIKQRLSDAAVGRSVVQRAVQVLQNTFAPDDPNVLAYLTVLARDDDAMQYRSTPAYSRTAFEEVDDMAANAGLDYTVTGRSIILWGTKHRIGTLPEFRDEDLGNSPIVSEYGMSMANRYVVSDGNGIWGEATRLDVSGNDEDYGLVEMLSSTWASDSPEDTGTYTQEGLATMQQSFEDFAERSIADRYSPGAPVVVRVPDNTSLNPGTVISIQQLVPGVVIPLRSTGTLREIVASQKLDQVKVIEQNGAETISLTMSPYSRDDNSTETVEEA